VFGNGYIGEATAGGVKRADPFDAVVLRSKLAHLESIQLSLIVDKNEIGYVDYVQAWRVDIPPGKELFATHHYDYKETSMSKRVADSVKLLNYPLKPITLAKLKGQDVTSLLTTTDMQYAKTSQHSVGWEYLEITLSDVPSGTPVFLVLDFVTLVTPEAQSHLIDHSGDFVEVFKLNPSSELYFESPIATVSDRKDNHRLVVVPVGSSSTKDLHLKIGFHRKTHIDFIGWDASFQPDLLLVPLDLASAHLSALGHRLQKIYIPGTPHFEYLMSPNVHAHSVMVESGNYTCHGDVTSLLASADDHLAVMAPGDHLTVTFKNEPTVGDNTRFILSGKAWYKAQDSPSLYSVFPLPVNQPSPLQTRYVSNKHKRGC
jgi:hypothetical protein